MNKNDPEVTIKKLKTLLDQYQRHIKRLELNLREEQRKVYRYESEIFNLKRELRRRGYIEE